MTATRLWLVRHGATEWSEVGKHTSVTDLPVLPEGLETARRVGERLKDETFGLVLRSPRLRAQQTAEAAGFPDAEVDEDLAEWAYGAGEGLTSDEIAERVPGWEIWTHGAPEFDQDGVGPGETVADVQARLARVVERVRTSGVDDAIVFAHGHSLRVLTTVWLDYPVAEGVRFPLEPATISLLGWEKDTPAVLRWNAPA